LNCNTDSRRSIAKVVGERNSFSELLQWSTEAVSFSWSVIESSGDRIAARLSDGFHRGSFRQVLSDQPIGIFVGASFPGVIRSCEVDGDAGRGFDLAIAVELSAVVGGDGFEQAAVCLDQFDQLGRDVARLARSDLAEQQCSGRSLYETHNAVLITRAENGVHLPVTNAAAPLGCSGSLGNVSFSLDAAALFVATIPFPIAESLTKKQPQMPAPPLVVPDVLVDRLVADLENTLFPEPATDLLGAEKVREQPLDQRPICSGKPGVTS